MIEVGVRSPRIRLPRSSQFTELSSWSLGAPIHLVVDCAWLRKSSNLARNGQLRAGRLEHMTHFPIVLGSKGSLKYIIGKPVNVLQITSLGSLDHSFTSKIPMPDRARRLCSAVPTTSEIPPHSTFISNLDSRMGRRACVISCGMKTSVVLPSDSPQTSVL